MYRSTSYAKLLCAVFVCALSFFSACTESTVPSTPTTNGLDSAVFVVNQGKFGEDNSSLSRIDPRTDSVVWNWYSDSNIGRKLGATANDILIKGDTAFISVTKSKTIEVINIKSGKLLHTMVFSGNDQPWKIALLSPQLAVVSTTNGDALRFFDPNTFALGARVHTGPATQGVCGNSRYAWVANSGYGDQRATEAGAGTISVVDLSTNLTSYTLTPGKNVTELCMSDDGTRVYAYYQELYSNPTAKQGIVEYDEATKLELRRWEFGGMGFLNYYNGAVYAIGKLDASESALSVLKVDTKSGTGSLQKVMTLSAGFYPNGFSVRKSDGSIWLSDAGDYNSRGNILCYSSSGIMRKSYSVGVAPGTVAFYH